VSVYTLAEAKARFSKVIEEVEAGHSVLITKHGRPVATMAQPQNTPAAPKRQLQGCLKNELVGWQIPDDFDRMMEDEIVALFEGDVQ
jgi:antitoxin (DNA-binding transcriptional repressor) of toxin-antitoxin stability system